MDLDHPVTYTKNFHLISMYFDHLEIQTTLENGYRSLTDEVNMTWTISGQCKTNGPADQIVDNLSLF